PLRYDDEVTIETRLADAGNSRIAFEYEVKKDGKITATGHTKHAFVDENGKPVSVPQRIKKALLAES
ncbi:MAG: acyl-CoA thioesterase, partial [Candidatus Omnitrophota bacterium]